MAIWHWVVVLAQFQTYPYSRTIQWEIVGIQWQHQIEEDRNVGKL